MAALFAVFVSAFVGHELGRRGRLAVDHAAAMGEALDSAHLAVAETGLALRELVAAQDAQRAETRRGELRRAAAAVGDARAALADRLAEGAVGPETEAILRNAAIDPLGVMADLEAIAAALAADVRAFGQAADRRAVAGLGLARQLLPVMNRLKATERAALAAAQARLSALSAAALALTAALLVALGLFVFLPLERRILSAQREIEEKRRAAEAASEAKSAFLATMSHEIRTPMNGVLGMAELLRASSLDDRQRRMAEIIASSGRSLMGILDSVLQFSRIEAGRLTLTPAPFDMAALVEEVGELFAPAAASKGLALTVRVDPGARGRLTGDEGAIRQIATNLVSNAVKFTEAGRVCLTLSDRGPGPGGRRIALAVTDTGVGIPAEAQSRIFESFEQADASITRRYGGAGLGLAISRGLVAAMGGELCLESAPGAGSTFTVRLTLPEAESRPAREARTGAA